MFNDPFSSFLQDFLKTGRKPRKLNKPGKLEGKLEKKENSKANCLVMNDVWPRSEKVC